MSWNIRQLELSLSLLSLLHRRYSGGRNVLWVMLKPCPYLLRGLGLPCWGCQQYSVCPEVCLFKCASFYSMPQHREIDLWGFICRRFKPPFFLTFEKTNSKTPVYQDDNRLNMMQILVIVTPFTKCPKCQKSYIDPFNSPHYIINRIIQSILHHSGHVSMNKEAEA